MVIGLQCSEKFFCIDGLVCVGHTLAYAAHFVILRDVWIRTQRAVAACRRATILVTYLPNLATHLPQLSHPSPIQLSHPSPIQLSHPSPTNLATYFPRLIHLSLQLSHPSPNQLRHPSPQKSAPVHVLYIVLLSILTLPNASSLKCGRINPNF
jgi:hypothetical protein